MRLKPTMGFEYAAPRPAPRPRRSPEYEAQREAALPQLNYRLMVFADPAGPWRSRLADVQRDAIRAGLASVDEWTGTLYLTVPAWFQKVPRTR